MWRDVLRVRMMVLREAERWSEERVGGVVGSEKEWVVRWRVPE